MPTSSANEVGPWAKTGGYRNDPSDPGGETKWGIAKRDHPTVDIASLTLQGAIDILQTEYWSYDGLEDICLCAKLLDLAVNMEGSGKFGAAVRIMQQAILLQQPGVLVADSSYGPETEKWANACNAASLLMAMESLACEHYGNLVAANPRLHVFLQGWIARANRTPEYNEQGAPSEQIQAASESAKQVTA